MHRSMPTAETQRVNACNIAKGRRMYVAGLWRSSCPRAIRHTHAHCLAACPQLARVHPVRTRPSAAPRAMLAAQRVPHALSARAGGEEGRGRGRGRQVQASPAASSSSSSSSTQHAPSSSSASTHAWVHGGAPKRVAVVGAGVVGLTSALRILQTFPPGSVALTVLAERFGGDTTSAGAAGIWGPYCLSDTPAPAVLRWSRQTYDELLRLAGTEHAAAAGAAAETNWAVAGRGVGGGDSGIRRQRHHRPHSTMCTAHAQQRTPKPPPVACMLVMRGESPLVIAAFRLLLLLLSSLHASRWLGTAMYCFSNCFPKGRLCNERLLRPCGCPVLSCRGCRRVRGAGHLPSEPATGRAGGQRAGWGRGRGRGAGQRCAAAGLCCRALLARHPAGLQVRACERGRGLQAARRTLC